MWIWNSWKKYYHPIRIGEKIMVVPAWQTYDAAPDDVRKNVIARSPLEQKYREVDDRRSAYEMAQEEAEAAEKAAAEAAEQQAKEEERKAKEKEKAAKAKKTSSSGRKRQSATEKAINTMATTASREVTKSLVRGLLGSLLKK